MRTERIAWRLVVVLSIVTFGLICVVSWLYLDQREQTSTAEQATEQIAEPAQTLADRVEAACRDEDDDPERDALRADGLCEQADQTRQAIEDAPVTPNAATPARGPAGPPPSLLQVRAAVQLEIGAALEAVCDGSCEGERGEPGESIEGPRGEPGESIQGQQGEPGQSIVGPKGDKGDSVTGPRGEPGRGIVGLANCQGGLTEFFSFDVAYSDGSTETVSCGMLPPIEPEPDPTPSQ